MFEKLIDQPGFWSYAGPFCDIVLSSRIRLARNMHTFPFPNKMEANDIKTIMMNLDGFLNESKFSNNLEIINLNEIGSSK